MLDIISEQELAENGVVSAPDKLTGDPEENKKIFDRLITAVLAPHINRVVMALNELEEALRTHVDVDPDGLLDGNIAVTASVVEKLGLEGINPTVRDALVKLDENDRAMREELNVSIGQRATVVSGSYVGTGACGEETPNRIEFDGKVQLLIVFSEEMGSSGYYDMMFVPAGCPAAYSSVDMAKPGRGENTHGYRVMLNWEEQAVSWWSFDDGYYGLTATGQLNTAGKRYGYIGFLLKEEIA